ncbi:MAG: hypothetical protein J6I42_06090, partial [Clostridia bacterium]|nr:hypothetical protein [Clostridia bacterium]
MAVSLIETPRGGDNFVFIPACCYAGNKFRVKKCSYPPMFQTSESDPEMPNTITDVPRVETLPDGREVIEVSTGDAAVPCIGVFSPSEKRGVLVFTVQEINGKNIGLAYDSGTIRLTWPAKRDKIYRMCRTFAGDAPWTDEPADIPHKVLDFPCETLADFYRVFFENRKIMGLDAERPETLPPEEQFAIQRDKFNAMNWDETLGIYMVGTDRTRFQVWQPGWTGGTMSGYALMKMGGELERERELKTLDFLFSTQGESGFFHGVIDAEGKSYGDGFSGEGTQNWHLIRKSADVLYFLFKHFRLMNERKIDIPENYLEGAKKTADGFVRLHKKFGQFGQFVDDRTG